MSKHLPIDLAHDYIEGSDPTIVFCGGFNSNRHGTKAMELQRWAINNGQSYVRFDYRGHGDSDGEFADCTITTWLQDTLAVIDALAPTPIILVGSSMGGWLALLAATKRPELVKGLVLIACAADMTAHYPARLTTLTEQQDRQGRSYFEVPNNYDDQVPYRIYQAMLKDGAQYALLNSPIKLTMPVRLIHGVDDDVVAWQRSQSVFDQLATQDCQLILIKHGDHRLSKPHEIRCIELEIAGLALQLRDQPQR